MKDTATHLTLLASVTHSLVKENQQLREELDEHSGVPKVYQVKKLMKGSICRDFTHIPI